MRRFGTTTVIVVLLVVGTQLQQGQCGNSKCHMYHWHIHHIITISLHPTTDNHGDEDHPENAEESAGENEDKDDSTSGTTTTTRVTNKCQPPHASPAYSSRHHSALRLHAHTPQPRRKQTMMCVLTSSPMEQASAQPKKNGQLV